MEARNLLGKVSLDLKIAAPTWHANSPCTPLLSRNGTIRCEGNLRCIRRGVCADTDRTKKRNLLIVSEGHAEQGANARWAEAQCCCWYLFRTTDEAPRSGYTTSPLCQERSNLVSPKRGETALLAALKAM